MRRRFGLSRHSSTDQARAIAKLDKELSWLVRTHYLDMGCFTCGKTFLDQTEADCGHFRRRERKMTRFDLRNIGIQCRKCNRFDGGRPFEFSLKLDEIWGTGTAKLMQELSKKDKLWEVKHLEQLSSAAKVGWLAYKQLYEELCPPTGLKTPRKSTSARRAREERTTIAKGR